MFSTSQAILCAFAALLIWSAIGFGFMVRLTDRFTAAALAPISGWAVQSVVAYSLYSLFGMSYAAVATALLLPAIVSMFLIHASRSADAKHVASASSLALVLIAASIAAAMAASVFPKYLSGGISLSPAIFDHTKVAIIDEIKRHGVPPINPFVSDDTQSGRLAYYYLWHFSAAQLAVLTKASGWTADAGLTWFTTFASLTGMMGLANWVAKSRTAAWLILPLACAGSLRSAIDQMFGWNVELGLFGVRTGFSGWTFQASWAPQHIAAATVVLVAAFVLVNLIRTPSLFSSVLLGVLAAAAFESSTWIGGIVFPAAAIIIGAVTLARSPPASKTKFATFALLAALITLAFTLPFIRDQINAASLRGDRLPIGFGSFESLGYYFSEDIRTILNPFTYWVITLPLELSSACILGTWAFFRFWRESPARADNVLPLFVFSVLVLVSATVGGYLVSKLGNNNDLAWRGILPAAMILSIFAAAGLSRYKSTFPTWAKIATIILIFLAAEDTRQILAENFYPAASPLAEEFEKSAAMWADVRRLSGRDDRVANNPDFLQAVTPWPVNASWALLSDRRSCYANDDLVTPFSSFNAAKRQRAKELFSRLFAGDVTAEDVRSIKDDFHCRLIVTTPEDGLWKYDVLETDYDLVETTPSWKIYRARGGNGG